MQRFLNIECAELIGKLVCLSENHGVCFLDSCGVSYLNSHLLICGIDPISSIELSDSNPAKNLEILDEKLADTNTASVFTLSYDFGLKLEKIKSKHAVTEPDLFLASYDALIVHDYNTDQTYLEGNQEKFDELESLLRNTPIVTHLPLGSSTIVSNLSRSEYFNSIDQIKELIRSGETYQVNLTQQFTAELVEGLLPSSIYLSLRDNNPTPFSAFLQRTTDTVISTSPERFFEIKNGRISASPIKGTRPRGTDERSDKMLHDELLASGKDRAENTMIVDLLRNDLGKVCEFGTVIVEKLCELEVHPNLFHLVSTISGELRKDAAFSDTIRSLFPCGSITGCPKIRTMSIIDELEPVSRGLSMGAIGYSNFNCDIDMSVAIRTMVIRDRKAVFNVGGGIVIDSEAESEYKESLTKAEPMLRALKANMDRNTSYRLAK